MMDPPLLHRTRVQILGFEDEQESQNCYQYGHQSWQREQTCYIRHLLFIICQRIMPTKITLNNIQ